MAVTTVDHKLLTNFDDNAKRGGKNSVFGLATLSKSLWLLNVFTLNWDYYLQAYVS